ncbi:hypothetical protein NONI108955_34280 [Nocardia ninae]|uniref:Uncharacterized protein n=1 Tax=Nocardia ninae NBRC 108245 TaxID=1210091 RepID=A0A511MRX1_9NOCA|nr:hypothetical protein [Nocardia ninae]GEM43352.1 hypothetical protein NN4_78710 [Nocardia ninae NBRC 108245]
MLSEADATGGWTFHEHPRQGPILTRRMYRRQLAIWEDGHLLQFQVDTDTATLRMGRRSTVAAAKLAAEKAARPVSGPVKPAD